MAAANLSTTATYAGGGSALFALVPFAGAFSFYMACLAVGAGAAGLVMTALYKLATRRQEPGRGLETVAARRVAKAPGQAWTGITFGLIVLAWFAFLNFVAAR